MELHLTNLVPDQIVKALCNTLIHSLWQGLILAALTGLTIVLTKKASAALRYNLMIGLLVLFTAGITVTFFTQLHTADIRQATPVTITTQTQVFQAVPTQVMVTKKPESIISNFIGFFNAHSDAVVLIWFLIICARFVQLAAGLHTIYHIKRKQVLSAGMYWNDQIRILSHQMGIKQTVKLMQSGIAKIPMVLGHFKPVILIPIGLLTALSAEEVESILVHELAHIHRRDYLVNLLQNLMEIIFFFNPAVLWVSSLIKTERENCCDDMVLAQTNNKVSYIKALVSCHEYQENMPAYAMGLGGHSDHFLQRAKRMLSNNNQSLNRVEKMVLIICLVVFGMGISAFTAREQIHKALKSVVAAIHHETAASKEKMAKNDTTKTKQAAPVNDVNALLNQVQQLHPDTLKLSGSNPLNIVNHNLDSLIKVNGNANSYLAQLGKQDSSQMAEIVKNNGKSLQQLLAMAKPDTNLLKIQKQVNKQAQDVGRELYREHLITDTNHLNITTNLDKRELIVNGVRMPDDVYQRIYTKFYKKSEGDGYSSSNNPRFESDADKTNNIISDMMKDGIITSTNDLSFKIGTTEFVVNYKKQPEAAYQKYRAKYVPSRPKGDWIWFYHFDTNKWDQMTGLKNSSDFSGSATGVFQGKENTNSSYNNKGYNNKAYSASANNYNRWDAYSDSLRNERNRVEAERDKKLVADLLHDGLITDPNNVTFTLNDKTVTINGKKQSDEVCKKYKEKYMPANYGSGWNWTYSHHE